MKKSILILLCFFISLSISAKTLEIEVIDTDLEFPLEGVKITAVNENSIVYTNEKGQAFLEFNDLTERAILIISLIGYETKKLNIKDFNQPLHIGLTIEGVIEGQELVVEEEAVSETDEEVGVSIVVSKEEMKSTANVGAIEDVMSSVKVLPGVTYGGKFDSTVSIRGGEKGDLTHVFDGFLVRYPYYFGNAFSIFNPNITDSYKLNIGIYPVNYGLSMSGLMEVNSITPNDGLKIEGVVSASNIEMTVQTPVGLKNAGLLLHGRITYYDLVFLMTGSIMEKTTDMTYSRIPYIYSTYLKWFWKPHERFEWYVNGFFGTDGIGVKTLSTGADYDTEIVNNFDFKYYRYFAFGVMGFKILPHDKIFIHVLGGYDFFNDFVDGSFTSEGTKKYSDEFTSTYGVPGSFSLDIASNFEGTDLTHGVQSRLDVDFSLHERVTMTVGTGFFLDLNFLEQSGNFWGFDGLTYKNTDYSLPDKDNRIVKSFGYLNFIFHPLPERIKIETGCRIDHNIIYGEDNYHINTYPVASPRLNVTFTPVKNHAIIENFSISTGVGLFNKTPLDTSILDEDFGIEDFEVKIPKTLMTLLGFQIQFPFGFTFKLEGYYKYFFHRYYLNLVTETRSGSSQTITEFAVHTDGYGHAGGFDLSLEKKISRFIDGSINYTFVYSRLYNPTTNDLDYNNRGEPLGKWYYPSYHRFHSLNIILNIHPTKFMTITPKFTFATGVPRTQDGDKQMLAVNVENDDGSSTIAEMYTRESEYSDTLRDAYVVPFDLRIAFHHYFPKTKVRLESYIAGEDIFVGLYNLYGPKSGAVQTNQYTGEEEPAPEGGFSMPFPMISFGVKVNF
ncbi:MAG: Plug domain-containing protein [Spirochaetes bacterium]|nr:Plug domain-containing protein [Spirochaetota bacterium]